MSDLESGNCTYTIIITVITIYSKKCSFAIVGELNFSGTKYVSVTLRVAEAPLNLFPTLPMEIKVL